MNYIDEVQTELAKHIKVGKGLMRVYSLLVLVKGVNTTLEDVHDAWAVNINENWDVFANGKHRSMIPFDQLPPEIQAKDQEYVDAIVATALALTEERK